MSLLCVFCGISVGKVPAKKIYEDAEIVAFHDINPQSPVHLLVIPRKHISNLLDIKQQDAALLSKMVMTATILAKEYGIAESGYRIVINTNRDAGQSIDHLHIHILGGRAMGWPPG
ncbi:MAG: histidine triad nucleotide-binding protein [Candidatus Omnitrophica bacterium]|nr:histidine triad nucleotide-binding protein [Candidatus Omnitrophota bacterium]MCM8788890.1 histidine triad nucleotide-binding protein [Candidatus Omnitrophota bacterium]